MFSRSELTFRSIKIPKKLPSYSDDQMIEKSREALAIAKTRHTIREFADQPVPQQVIENAIATAGRAPSGANHQPWHFVAVKSPVIKAEIRAAAEKEEENFYEKTASDEWLKALEPLGTNATKEHLTAAPWLIVIFAQRHGQFDDGTKFKNYYVTESVSIATGFLISALHQCGLATLTHTPNPMEFLRRLLKRPSSEKPLMILAVGHPHYEATIPQVSTIKKPLTEIMTIVE